MWPTAAFRDMTRDRQTDRQTSAPFHDMATRSGPHNKRQASDQKCHSSEHPTGSYPLNN